MAGVPDDRALSQEQAQARADQLNRELPAGAEHHWIAHHVGGERWDVARVSAAGMPFGPGPRETTGERGPEREDPTDPRPTITRLIPPYGPGAL